ncbi:hypothetical protein N8T08_004025 [Aspergillus melleus]|uniref:Uncharacterized protein n=1 Tax=Aspergillus melleus TaxID=138277 RepID=A0ACC3B664_9EURO|nr:hypothetical protein N8T08_004025 [Aspergillus melleus]
MSPVQPQKPKMARSNDTAMIPKPIKSPGVGKKTTNTPAKKVPRQDSPRAKDPLNFTSYRPDQEHWSWNSLPEVLYQLKPTEKRKKGPEPPLLTYRIHGEYLRELPVLPDNTASNVEEFRVEAWMRLDRRIQLRDIKDRMHKDFRVSENTLQQRNGRFRRHMRMLAWDSGNKKSQEFEAELMKDLLANDIDPSLNSTRGITPGLIDPVLGEAGGRIALPTEYKRREIIEGQSSTSEEGNSLEESKEDARKASISTQVKRARARDPMPPPSFGCFPQEREPWPETVLPENIREIFIDQMLKRCFRGEGYLFQLPYMCEASDPNV